MTDSKEDGANDALSARLLASHDNFARLEGVSNDDLINVLEAATALSASSPPVGGSGEVDIDVDELAGEIRYVDGEHKLGAGALAEALSPYLRLVVRSTLAAPVPNGVPEGFRLVPIEPTEAMVQAGMARLGWLISPTPPEYEYGNLINLGLSEEEAAEIEGQLRTEFGEVYSELLAASPVSPEGLSGGAGWIEWKGGECPVDPAAMIQFKLRNGSLCTSAVAGEAFWTHDPDLEGEDIIAYRLAKTV